MNIRRIIPVTVAEARGATAAAGEGLAGKIPALGRTSLIRIGDAVIPLRSPPDEDRFKSHRGAIVLYRLRRRDVAVLAREPDQQVAAGRKDHGGKYPAAGIVRIITERVALQVDVLIAEVEQLDPVLVVPIIIEVRQGIVCQEFVDDNLGFSRRRGHEKAHQHSSKKEGP